MKKLPVFALLYLLLLPIYLVKPVLAVELPVDTAILDATDEFGPSPTMVFTSALNGYVFFIDGVSQDLAYRKTTDGGLTWTTLTVIDTVIAGWTSVAVWYDQWTPGDTTGTRIHIAAADDAADDIFYTYLDTASDTPKGSLVTAVSGTTTLNELIDGPPTISKGAGGALFIAANFTNTAGGKVSKSTDGVGDVWGDVTPTSWSSVAIDQVQLVPLITGQDVMAIRADTANNDIDFRIYDEVADTWDTSWTSIATMTENTTYDQWFAATIKKSTGDVYLTFANETSSANNDIEFWSFSESGRSWTQQSNLFTNDATVIAPVPVMNETDGSIYVTYLRGSLANQMGVFNMKTIDGGITWSEESSQMNAVFDDHKTVKSNFLSTYILGILWYNDDLNDIYFSPIKDGSAAVLDSTILDGSDEFAPSPSVVFISDQVGYAFYVDATSQTLGYVKTTNGGGIWSNVPTTIDTTIAGWTTVAVWYDQWTPGDTTGTRIHIAASDDASDDIFYTYLDTNGDTLKGTMVTAVSGTTTLTEIQDGPPSITKGAGGALFISANFTTTAGGKVAKSVDGVGDVWADVTPTAWSTVAIDQIQLLPLVTDNDIIAIKAQTADNTIRSRVYDEAGDAWDGAWGASIGSLTENTTYDQWFAATIKKSTGDVYLTFANQSNNANNDVEFYTYTDSGRSWTQNTNLFTNDATVIAPVPLINENNGTIYVAYLRGTLATAMGVYYKYSIDGGANWIAESENLNPSISDDVKALRGNLLDTERLYVVWYNDDLNDLFGNTVVDIYTAEQSAYVFFENTDSTGVGLAYGEQNTPHRIRSTGDPFRLRMLMHFGGRLKKAGAELKLQFAQKSGTCDTSFAGETYADVTTSTEISYYDNPSAINGQFLTPKATDPTHGSDVIANQTYRESNNFTNNVSAVMDGEDAKWDFSLYDNGAPPSTDYCLRIVRASGLEYSVYDVIPMVTTDDGVEAELVFSISDLTLGFGTLTPSGARYATGTVGATSDTADAHTLSASTTGSGGYAITVTGLTLTCSVSPCNSETVDAIGGTAVASNPGTEQFGMRVIVNSGTGTATAPYNGSDWAFDTASFPDEIASGDGDDVTTQFGIRFIGNIADTTEPGTYSTELLYTITGTF